MQLFLIRHPRPAVAAGICYGRSDLPPADDVAAVAANLMPQLPKAAPVYTSPLGRCRLLAGHLHSQPITDARLSEADFGDWEMRRWDDIGRAALDAWAADPLGYAGHGGESVAQVRARVAAFFADLSATNLPATVVVTHAGVMKLACADLLGLAQDEWLGLRFAFGRAIRIDIDGGAARRIY